MPKSLLVDPADLRRPGTLTFPEIPIHRYATPLADEIERRGAAALQQALRHMMIVRAFEEMLTSFKAKGRYANISYNYLGPAHLSVGQEATAVGAALALEPGDHIFGSHRSHGEFIAKGLAAIASLDEGSLQQIMEDHADGALLRTVETALPAASIRARAERFLLLGFLAEIFMRENGFNRGMGGSMHAFFTPFGAYPNNAIVGASAGIAAGSALRRKLSGDGGISVAMVGDGSTGCGAVWEALNFAAMGQYDTLWSEAPGGLPVLFFFSNNFYAMGGQTRGETMGWDRLARIGAGIEPTALHAETVDGTDPLAVADAVARQRKRLSDGAGPGLLDVECYRASGHSSSDANAYRTREEIAAWAALDPVQGFASRLSDAGCMEPEVVELMQDEVAEMLASVTAAAVDPELSPSPDLATDPLYVGRLMFSGTEIPDPAGGPPVATLTAPETTIRVRQNAKKSRAGLGPDGANVSPMRAITLRDGLFEAILHHMLHDDRLIAYGEECREWGGAFGVYRGLSDIFPHERLFNAPISEAAILSTAVGYAMEGGRALVELMYGDFIGRAGDEILNQLAKWQAMSGGTLALPVVLRCSIGSKYGAQHSQDWSALAAHVPGLKIAYPATPHDAKGLMASALASNDPVIVFESQRLYDRVETFEAAGVPTDYYRIPLGQPATRRTGTDLTILTIGPSLYPALEAAGSLETDHGLSAEIIDARGLVPFDYAPLLASVARTGRLLIVSEACMRGSFAMTLAATVTRYGFDTLQAAPRVLGTPNWIVPGADMEARYFPQAGDVVAEALDLAGRPGSEPPPHRSWDPLALAREGL